MTCIDVGTSNPIDCEMWFETEFKPPADPDAAISYTGGHIHPLPNGNDPARPIGVLCSSMDTSQGVCPPKDSSAETPHGFHGTTRGMEWEAVKTMPQLSGMIDMTARYRLLRRDIYCIENEDWVCDADKRGGSARFRFFVAVRGLVELPPDPSYIRCGDTNTCTTGSDNGDPNHTSVFFGTDEMVRKTQLFAFWYNYVDATRRLRLTDMSLPLGGLLDINEDWRPPHAGRGHRFGTGVDVSQQARGDDGKLWAVEQGVADFIACACGLRRYDKEKPRIHYNLGKCAPKGGGK